MVAEETFLSEIERLRSIDGKVLFGVAELNSRDAMGRLGFLSRY